MKKPPIAKAILFMSRTGLKPLLRNELSRVGITEVITPDFPEGAVLEMQRDSQALLILDTEHGAEIVNQVLRAAQGSHAVDTRPIFLIATEVNISTVSLVTEYNVSRMHSGEISREVMKDHIDAVVASESDAAFKSSMMQVADARSRGRLALAGTLLYDLQKRFPGSKRVACELASHHIQMGDWRSAQAIVEMLAVLDSEDLRVQQLKARCLMKQGDFAGAEAILQKAQLINPFNVERLVDLGEALLNQDRIKEALEHFEAALSIDVGAVAARRGRASCRLLVGDVNEALELMRQLSGPRELAAVFNNSAVLAIRHGRFGQGMNLYRTAIGALGPTEQIVARLLYNLGIACHKQGRSTEAYDCFAKAYEADKSFNKARRNALAIAAKIGMTPGRALTAEPVLGLVQDEFGNEFPPEVLRAE